MVSQLDLDQGGTARQWVRKFLGSSLGWAYVPNDAVLPVTTGGTTTVSPGVSLILVDVASPVTLQLPTAIEAVVGPQTLVYGYERVPITIVDLGGHASANNITILPFGSEKINGNSSAAIQSDYRTITLLPNIVNGGWNITNITQTQTFISNVRIVTAAGADTITAQDEVVIYNKAAPSVTAISLPAVATRNLVPLEVYDWAGNAGDLTFTPNGAEKIMNEATWVVTSGGVGLGGSIRLLPCTAISGWLVL